jgi:hypothetical protein
MPKQILAELVIKIMLEQCTVEHGENVMHQHIVIAVVETKI